MASLWRSLLGSDTMSIAKDSVVTLIMGFSTQAKKLQVNDRIRGYQNSYITILDVSTRKEAAISLFLDDGTSLCVSKQQPVFTANGWKQADQLVEEEWLCGQEENVYYEIKKITLISETELIYIQSMEVGSYLANGIVLAADVG